MLLPAGPLRAITHGHRPVSPLAGTPWPTGGVRTACVGAVSAAPTLSPSKRWAPRSGPRGGEHPHLQRTPQQASTPPSRTPQHRQNPTSTGHPHTPSTPPPQDTPTFPVPHLHRTPPHSQYPTSTGHPRTASTPPPQDTPALPVPTFSDTPARPALGLQTPLESPGLSRLTSTRCGRTGLTQASRETSCLLGTRAECPCRLLVKGPHLGRHRMLGAAPPCPRQKGGTDATAWHPHLVHQHDCLETPARLC
ncbi:anti-sigma-I factor RsgI2-like isoform X2 [Ovis aries]|uniref:anti-sigma-I factor RsgI2-like isoform X2 n=1 Tax=Ovis aries TaxID=9940 RepID=UPI0029526E3C|nr:anti-sigma-I factor RsgI2-like isoform X2 [Ovis aries]